MVEPTVLKPNESVEYDIEVGEKYIVEGIIYQASGEVGMMTVWDNPNPKFSTITEAEPGSVEGEGTTWRDGMVVVRNDSEIHDPGSGTIIQVQLLNG